jgi:cytochrome c biogenesis protein CcmG/thiol:disulfide interchange protein DsbE
VRRRRSAAVRFALLAALVALLSCLLLPAAALADGDPGSDVLLDQNLFAYWDAHLTASQQLRVGALLDATAHAGAPVRVAIIAQRDDLGTVAALWHKPQQYAEYLGYEISLSYSGRLLIVMPNGYGVYWKGNPRGAAKLKAALTGERPRDAGASALVGATVSAVQRIELLAGVSPATLEHSAASSSGATTPTNASGVSGKSTPTASVVTHTGSSKHSSSLGVLLAIVLVVGLTGYMVVRSGRLSGLRLPPRRSRSDSQGAADERGADRRIRLRPSMAAPLVLFAIVALALVVNQTGSSTPTAQGGTLATNAELDPGTALPHRTAPNFTLIDESGHHVSLAQYRGKVVVLSFVDAECQTICPLTTQAMVDAKAALGKAGKDVQLLGVNANWKSTQVDDVLNYTELHGLAGRWHFLTGSVPQLERVWTAYHVNEKALEQAGSNDIEHIAATYVIDRQGRLRDVFTTYPSYAAIGQVGQLIAGDAAALLPGHPRVAKSYSYAQIRGISPSKAAALPKLGGGSVKIGPGAARLYLFFATWDAQTTPISAQLEALNRYSAQARKQGLPPLTAIDEGSVEPSATALPAFIKSLPSALSYPVATDLSGRVADGYDVEGEPWFVLTNAAGQIEWYQEVYTSGWPTLAGLVRDVRAALKPGPNGAEGTAAAKLALAGSPAPLALLHAESSQLIAGGQAALDARIGKLRGYPIVVNIWGSWCAPCQKEFPLFSQASAQYGKRVAFLGADTDDQAANARSFLRTHPVSYPSYATTDTSVDQLLSGGLEATPTTVFYAASGKIVSVHIGEYASLGTLEQDIQDAVLGSH